MCHFSESQMMSYTMSTTGKPHLEKGVINVVDDGDLQVKYTFSDAISSSVKLGSWESDLERIIDSIEFITDDLRRDASIRISAAYNPLVSQSPRRPLLGLSPG